MSDLISRKAAIEALKEAFNPSITNFVKAKMAIDNLPPAQPEKHTENTRKTHACDLIDRQAAIDVCDYAIDLWHGQLGEGIVIAVKKKIEELPSAQPEPHWIPVTDRLPEFKYETYDDVDGYTFWDTDFVIGTTSRGTLSIGQFTRDSDEPNEYHWDACECDAFDLQGCLRLGDHIIAWMPLPEPYREGE